MTFSLLKDIKFNAWYRGSKIISITSIKNNTFNISNGDVLKIVDNEIYLNGTLICNDNITEEQLIDLYKYILKKKGYKFLD